MRIGGVRLSVVLKVVVMLTVRFGEADSDGWPEETAEIDVEKAEFGVHVQQDVETMLGELFQGSGTDDIPEILF